MKKAMMILLAGLLALSFIGIASATECNIAYPPGTATPGYWMNHPDAWPVATIWVGGVEYPKELAIYLMKQPVKGDKTLTMFAAYVAAKLNVIIGNCPPTCYSLCEVDQWLKDFPVGSDIKASSEPWQHSHGESLYWCLDDYNNGYLPGIPSRDALESFE